MPDNTRLRFDDDVQPAINGSSLSRADDDGGAGILQNGWTINSIASMDIKSSVNLGSNEFPILTEVDIALSNWSR